MCQTCLRLDSKLSETLPLRGNFGLLVLLGLQLRLIRLGYANSVLAVVKISTDDVWNASNHEGANHGKASVTQS